MTPRSLNARVTLQSPTTTQDALGQPQSGWTDVATIYADIRHPGGLEAIKGGAEMSTVRASVRIRHRSDVDASMRLLFGSVVYQVKACLPDARKRWLDLVCEVVA